MMDYDELKKLQTAEHLLKYAADGLECYCDEDGCSALNPKCRDMHTAAALAAVQHVLEPPHISLQPKRLVNDAERIFAAAWDRTNVRKSWMNHGYTTIEWILCPEDDKYPSRVSIRDARVAASVIQWLGTSCGFGFTRACEQEINDARVQRSKWGDYVNHNAEPPAGDLAIAELLAGRVKGHPAHADLVRGIVAALVKARGNGMASLDCAPDCKPTPTDTNNPTPTREETRESHLAQLTATEQGCEVSKRLKPRAGDGLAPTIREAKGLDQNPAVDADAPDCSLDSKGGAA